METPATPGFPGIIGESNRPQTGRLDSALERGSDFRRVVNECAQRPQPGFVAPPARNRSAIDWLAGLPLARSLHGSRIVFWTQACVVPRQAASRDDPADDPFGRTAQILVIDLDEAICWQNTPPMLDEPHVVA